jgi:hypothetical protein
MDRTLLNKTIMAIKMTRMIKERYLKSTNRQIIESGVGGPGSVHILLTFMGHIPTQMHYFAYKFPQYQLKK